MADDTTPPSQPTIEFQDSGGNIVSNVNQNESFVIVLTSLSDNDTVESGTIKRQKPNGSSFILLGTETQKTNSNFELNTSFSEVGIHQIRAYVTDGGGNQSQNVSGTISVQEITPPNVSISTRETLVNAGEN